MARATKSEFQTQPARDKTRSGGDAVTTARREDRKQTLAENLQKISPVIRSSLVEFFRSMHLSTVDYTGEEQVAVFKEETGATQHTWKASSWKKTGTHTEYRSDGAHSLDEHTAYAMTVVLFVNQDNLPLLHLAEYAASKLVGKIPVIASNFTMDVPTGFKDLLREQTGIRLAEKAEYIQAQDR